MFFQQDKNCRHYVPAERIAFLVDGEDYYRAVAEACEAAREAIYIIGWDIDSRIRLRRGKDDDPETFGAFLDRLARQNPELNIYLLEWDFAMFYSLEREAWSLVSFGWLTHERVHFELDDRHPVGASHHQKLVVVDDQVAFVGGFDLASYRWDTAEHLPQHPQRNDNGTAYNPVHDVQMLVDGPVARCIADLARQRWERMTGERLTVPAGGGRDRWPDSVPVALEGQKVAVLLTEPEYEGLPEVRDIEKFYLAAIDRAEKFIYMENQYLTSQAIGDALAKSLAREHGPEILLVLPRYCPGWLEEETMGALRQRLLRQLQAADRFRRLKVCYPQREDFSEQFIVVHSKLLFVDDRLLTVGSANLSNRSMGFDTECNLALAAEGDPTVANAIVALRDHLLAEHLGVTPTVIAERLAATGSLLQVAAGAGKDGRSLQNVVVEEPGILVESFSAETVFDPERPVTLDHLLDYLGIGGERQSGQEPSRKSLRLKAWGFVALLFWALVVAGLWRWTPFRELLSIDRLLAAADYLRDSVLAIPIVLAIYLVGSCLMIPVNLLILATAFSFGSVKGFVLALTGSLVGGLAGYLLGRWLGREAVSRFAGEKLNRLSRKLARRGWLAMALIRVVPIAPYTIVNMVAGATHISTRSFLIGTAIGMCPGILAIMIFEEGLERLLRNQDWGNLGLAVIALLCAVAVLLIGRRWIAGRDMADE